MIVTRPAKVRILHIFPNAGPGGAERLVVDLLEATDKERFEVAAVSLYPESGTILEREIKKKGLKVYFLNKHRGLDLRMIPQLYRVLRTFCPDVVHTHRYVLRYTLLPTLLCRIPVRIHTVHNVAQKEVDRIGKLVHWISFRLGKVVPVSISKEIANTVRAVYGQDIYTPVIYNGIPITRFVSSASQDSTKEEKDVVLLHVGRFAPQKSHPLLVEAFALAVKEYPAMKLWLVGDGPLKLAVKKNIVEMGLERKVLFLGIRDDVPRLLAAADLFVLSSDYEGVPLSVLEAMAAGKPVVATAVGGVPELVEDGVTGVLVPPRNPEALAKGILRLAKDADLRRRMGKAARERALERFDISRTAREYEALYLKLLEKCGRI
jgi:sugar transferase (PEP-CTERM/EpsH1 system associated)